MVLWDLLSSSVKGVAKQYSQDSFIAHRIGDGQAVVLAVADGHGSKTHHRSDLGSRWAVEAFAACAEVFAAEALEKGEAPETWPSLLASARSMSRRVVDRWRERALLHDSNSPAAGGLPATAASTPGGGPAVPDVRPYGSTLLGAVITGRLLVCWRLGDGDIVLIPPKGTPKAVLHDGPDLGDETHSLCEPQARWLMRVHWQPFTGEGPPPAVLLSTDGLSKSFAEYRGFIDFARGLGDRVATHGLSAVQDQLEDWLTRAASYSGDDTTLVGTFPSPRQGPAAVEPPPGGPPKPHHSPPGVGSTGPPLPGDDPGIFRRPTKFDRRGTAP